MIRFLYRGDCSRIHIRTRRIYVVCGDRGEESTGWLVCKGGSYKSVK